MCAVCIEEIFENKDEVCIVKFRHTFLLIVDSTHQKRIKEIKFIK